jgi:hypothetical protein
MKSLSLLLLVLLLTSCQLSVDAIIRKEPEILGEWRYLAVGWHNAYMTWNLDTFQFAKAPRIVFLKDGSLTGQTGLNAFQGTYDASVANIHPQKISAGGSLKVSIPTRLRTDMPTSLALTQDELLDAFQQATSYHVAKRDKKAEYLSVNYATKDDRYLIFVRKK